MGSTVTAGLLGDNASPPLIWAEAPPRVAMDSPNSSEYTCRSIETLVVVLAVITIVSVIAGFVARLCGGRHVGGNGENDVEGWIEKKCRSCIDGGLPPLPSPAAPETSKPPEKEANK